MSHMRDEIRAQPEAIARFLDREAPSVSRLVAACRSRGIRQVFIAARGTSDHAAVYAKYLIEIATGLPVCLAASSVFTLYGARLRLEDALVLGISQSGRAGDACDIVQLSRDAGRLTACITNHPQSDLARAAEHVIT